MKQTNMEKSFKVVAIAAGDYHSLLLDSQGQVYSFGYGIHGQLGLGAIAGKYVSLPTLIKTVGGIVAISAGQYHSLLLDSQGRVFSFGNNESGQLGLGDNRGRMIPTLIRDIPGGAVSSIVSIAAAVESSLISDTLGRVFGFGENNYKQLGPGPEKILTPTLIEGLTI